MVKHNSKRTRKGTVGKKDNVSKKNKLISNQKQIRKQVLKGGGTLEVITFENQEGLLTLPPTTHPYGYYPTFDNQTQLKNRRFSKNSDIFSFGCLIIDLFSNPEVGERSDKEVVKKNHKKLAYNNNSKKKEENELKSSRDEYETYVDSLLINSALQNNRPTFRDIIKKLVTLILGHSVINFENDEFGFDEIIKLLERIKGLRTINQIKESSKDAPLPPPPRGAKILDTEENIKKYLEEELERLFKDPYFRRLESALEDESAIKSIKTELKDFFNSEEFKTTQMKDSPHLNFDNLDICINSLLEAITNMVNKTENELDDTQIYTIKTELKSLLNEVYETEIENYERKYNKKLLEATVTQGTTYSEILTPIQKGELLKTLSPFDGYMVTRLAISGGALFSNLQPHLTKMSQDKPPISGNFGTTFFGKVEIKPAAKKKLFTFKRKALEPQEKPQEFELAFKTVETSNDEISATIRRKLNRKKELTFLEEYNKAIESILDFYNESLIASKIKSSSSDKFPKYYGFSINPIEITKGSGSKTNNENPKLFMEYLKGNSLKFFKFDKYKKYNEDTQELQGLLTSAKVRKKPVDAETKAINELKLKIETNKLNNSDLVNYLIKIAKGMKDLHEMGILHLDLAARNIMMVPLEENDYNIKIIDFGKSKILPNLELTDEQSTVKDIIESLYKDSKDIFLKKTELNEKIPLFYSNLEIEPITSDISGGSRNNSTKKSKKSRKSRKSRKSKKSKKRVKHNSTKKTHKKKD